MNKKGFVFSVTALHYVALFLLFLSLYIFILNKPVIVDSMHSVYSRVIYKYHNSDSQSDILANGWCSVYLEYDPEKMNFDSPSTLTTNKYCEIYGK